MWIFLRNCGNTKKLQTKKDLGEGLLLKLILLPSSYLLSSEPKLSCGWTQPSPGFSRHQRQRFHPWWAGDWCPCLMLCTPQRTLQRQDKSHTPLQMEWGQRTPRSAGSESGSKPLQTPQALLRPGELSQRASVQRTEFQLLFHRPCTSVQRDQRSLLQTQIHCVRPQNLKSLS